MSRGFTGLGLISGMNRASVMGFTRCWCFSLARSGLNKASGTRSGGEILGAAGGFPGDSFNLGGAGGATFNAGRGSVALSMECWGDLEALLF